MKRNLNSLAIILSVVFVLLTIGQFFYVFKLPADIAQSLDMKENELMYKIHGSIHWLHAIDIMQFISAIMVIISFFYVNKLNRLGDSHDVYDFEDDDVEDIEEVELDFKNKLPETEETLLTDLRFKEIIEQASIGTKTYSKFGEKFCSRLADELEASQIALYRKVDTEESSKLVLIGSFAFHRPDTERTEYDFGEGLVGQSAKSKKAMKLHTIPENYISIVSGLGQSTPKFLLIIPLIEQEQCIGALEIASFKSFQNNDIEIIQNGVIDLNKAFKSFSKN